MMEPRLGPPPVEPLSDIAWSRVERGLWTKLDREAELAYEPPAPTRQIPWRWIAAPSLALAAALVLAVVWNDGGDPSLAVDSPARVVSAESPSSIAFGDAHVTLEPHSAVVMNRDDATPNALLEQGSAWFAVAPRKERPPFVVLAGDVRIRVIGTRFRVARSSEQVRVEVEHGLVEVQHRETVLELRAGQQWSSGAEAARGDDTATHPEPPELELPPDRIVRPSRTQVRVEPKRDTVALDPTDDTKAQYDRLAALEVRDPDAAIQGYLALSKQPGRWAANALFAAGRLAADRRDPRAQTFLEIYLRRFPRGANADDARELLAHIKGDPR